MEKGKTLSASALTSLFIAVLFSVYLLAVGKGGYTSITSFKYGLFLAICGAYAFGLTALFCRRRARPKVGRGVAAVLALMGLFLLFTAVSACLSPYFPQTLLGFHRREGLLTVACYGLCFFGAALFGRPSRRLIAVFAVSVVLFCLVCFSQLLGGNPFHFYPEGLTYYDGNDAYRYEFIGTAGNAGLTGAVLSAAGPLLTTALLRGQGKSRFLLLIPVVMVWAVTLKIRVAAAVAAVFGGTLLLLPSVILRNPAHRRRFALVLLLVVLLAIAGIYCFDIGGGTLHELHALSRGEWDDGFGTGRLFIWRSVAALVPERPLFGGGCDTLGQRMTAEFRRYDAAKDVTYTAAIDAAHNEYLNILVSEGLLAFSAYAAALVLSLALVVRHRQNNAAVIWGSGAFGYGVQAFFGLRVCIAAPFLFLCWGLALAALREE